MGALSEEQRKDYLPLLLTELLKASTLNKGIILEVSSWGCCAAMLPPGKTLDNLRTMLQLGLVPATSQLKPMGINGSWSNTARL
ncbi:hypothetical protein F4801DRAFT_559216 [Xylaria longipes]|nr:hypothetical protein F4801DRAFT_559216 [Xylaria longipes]